MTQTKDSTTGEPSHREKLLAKALGDVLVAAGVMREASATGPELLHMAESYVLSAPSRMAASSEGEGQPIRYHLTEPTVEINGRMLGEGWLLITEAEYAALTALAVPDKGVQGDQGSSGGLGQPGSGSQPGADVGATAALAIWDPSDLDRLDEIALHLSQTGNVSMGNDIVSATIALADRRDVIADLSAAMREACDLLAERRHGNPARSAGHNARLCLESVLASRATASATSASGNEQVAAVVEGEGSREAIGPSSPASTVRGE
jgi:hypothetical protein